MPKTKIFISSTSIDLSEHRKRLMETLARLRQDGIGMESFGASPDTPVELCKSEVERADLVVLVLAHRYGWVPSTEQGGDGERSITRIEFDQARNPTNGPPKPVLAFLVDEKADWTAGREQDDLLQAPSQEHAVKVYKAVQALKQFKSDVNRQFVRDTFTTPADLADKVGSAIANWLLAQQSIVARTTAVEQEVQELFEKVDGALRDGMYDLALTYLDSGARTAADVHLSLIADKRLEIASEHLSLYDDRLLQAAEQVRATKGKQQALASLTLGKTKSQRSRTHWKEGRREDAWALASEARTNFKEAAAQNELNPDVFGSLGGLLKRMAQWARELRPNEVLELENAMLAAYKTGWQNVPDAYPLLNYIEQRAALEAQRNPSEAERELIRKDEPDLRRALQQALSAREKQLGNTQNRPWAAFDLARGRHYLQPNVPGFLEDLSLAVKEARSMARITDDRYPVTTTCDSLRALLAANVRLEGLCEGLDLLERAVASDDWFIERPQVPAPYFERELQELQATVRQFADQQLRLSALTGNQIASFINATELRWSREDEERFQAELVKWKRDLEPTELKIVRGMWKIFGSKTLDAFTGGIPVDWNAALELVRR